MGSGEENEWSDRALIEKIIAYLDDPEDRRGVWRGLRFMETNGIDFALRGLELHAYLVDDRRSPLHNPADLTLDQERAIVLALREAARQELGLPPLTDDEKAAWRYEPWAPTPWRPDQLIARPWAQTHHPTKEEVKDLRKKLSQDSPELMQILRLFSARNLEIDDYSQKLSTLWLYYQIREVIASTRPELDASGVHNLCNELQKDVWERPF